MLSPEYDRLVDIMNQTRNDIIIGRLEAGSNDITSTKYGINQFPILALFRPDSKRIVSLYQGIRQGENIANWINQLCPKIKIKEEEENNNKLDKIDNAESLHIDIDTINRTQLTDKKEFIKQQFFKIKKQLDEIEEKIEKGTEKSNKRVKNRRIRITFDFTFINIFMTVITLLIFFAFYKTGRKLLINAGHHKD
jgi:tetrahydromethanopterin S-methyltransferase subunit G